MCERLPGESRQDMLSRLYHRTQIRNSALQLRCDQAESRAIKAERVADHAIHLLALVDRDAAAVLQAEAASQPAP